jgi:hypothetical protein
MFIVSSVFLEVFWCIHTFFQLFNSRCYS